MLFGEVVVAVEWSASSQLAPHATTTTSIHSLEYEIYRGQAKIYIKREASIIKALPGTA
jgi:hypothetical protein